MCETILIIQEFIYVHLKHNIIGTVFNIHCKNRFIASCKQFVTNLISDIDLRQ